MINTLDYFLTKHPEKLLRAADGQSINQIVVGNSSYYVKTLPSIYEYHTWDNDWIYLKFDCTMGAVASMRGYSMNPGRWLPRVWKVGLSHREATNILTWYDKNCIPVNPHRGPYTIKFLDHKIHYDFGGDIGPQETIIIQYHNDERFYYTLEWGWVKWEKYFAGQLIQTTLWNKIENKPLQVRKSCNNGQ